MPSAHTSYHRDYQRGDYLIGLWVDIAIGRRDYSANAAPLSFMCGRAVVDDFGNLVLVRGWL